MTTLLRTLFAGLILSVAAAQLLTGAGSRAWAGNVEDPAPPPITTTQPKPAVPIELPKAPVVAQPAAQAAPGDGGAKDAPAVPKKERKRLKPDELLSQKSLLYIGTENFGKAKAEFLRSALAGLMLEDDVSKSLAQTFRQFKESYINGSGARNEYEIIRRTYETALAEKLFSYLSEHTALAVEASVPAAGGAGVLPDAQRFIVALSFPSGDEGEQNLQALSSYMENFLDNQRGTRFKEDAPRKVGPYDILGLRCADLGLMESWAFVENLFLYGQGDGIVMEAVKAYHEQQGRGTLSQSGTYRAAMAQVGEREAPPQLFVQFESKDRVKAMLRQERWIRYLSHLVLPSLDRDSARLALGMRVLHGEREASIKEKLLLAVPRRAGTAACKAISSYLTSADAVYYHARQDSISEILKPLVALTAERDPNKPAGPLAGFLPELIKALGVDNEDGAWKSLEPFQGEMAVLVNYMAGENLLANFQDVFQIVFALEINRADLARATATLTSLERATRLDYKKYNYGTAEIHYQFGAKPDEAARGGRVRALLSPLLNQAFSSSVKVEAYEGSPFFVAYAMLEVSPPNPGEQARQFVLLSDNLRALEKAVQQVRLPKQALAENKAFRELNTKMLDTRYAINYLDLPKFADSLYHNVFPARARSAGHTSQQNREFTKALPADATLARHLSPMAWGATVVDGGELVEFVSPLGNAPLLGLIGALALPAINAEKAAGIARQVDENFRHISYALQLYAAAYDRFPTQLSDLVPDFVGFEEIRRVFSSPFAPGAVQRKEDVDEPGKTNMKYRPGRNLQDIAKEILVYEVDPTKLVTDKGKHVKSLHHVLTVDGRVNAYPKTHLDKWILGQLDVGALKDEEPAPAKK